MSIAKNATGDVISKRAQMIGVWSGLGFVFLFFLASWPMAQFIPPPSPQLTGQELLAKYAGHIGWVHASMPVGLIAGMLIVPFSTTMAIQIARLEGRIPFWAITCIGAAAANAVAFYLPFVFWAAGYYRLDRDPELVRLISDMAWLEYLMVWPPIVMQILCVAIAGLSYKGPQQVFPRWFCFLSVWVSVMIIPASLCVFVYSGPFSWNGVITWWIPCLSFAFYYLVLVWILRRAVLNHAAATTDN